MAAMPSSPERSDEPARRLVVAYAFAPYADTSAVAATKRVAVDGVPVDVISNKMDSLRARDESLAELVDGLLRRRVQLDTPTMFGGWSSVLSFTRAGQRALRRWDETPAGTPYTSLYSRAHFVASHVLAATVVGSRPLQWRAEISDPLSRTATGERRDGPTPQGALAEELADLLATRGVRMSQDATIYEWAETLPYVLADEVVFTSDGQREYCLSVVEDPVVRRSLERSARVVPHATMPEEWYSRRRGAVPLEAGRTHVGYFGGFYASQDPDSLLRAVATMRPEDRARLRVHLFTGLSGELAARIDELRVDDTVLLHDRLPFLDFLAVMRQMDVLLAIDAAPVPGGVGPHVRLSKWSDYIGAGVETWGIVAEGSDLAAQTLTHRTPLHHRTAALQTLTTLARRAS